MTTFYLIRHGTTGAAGTAIYGRTPGVHLDDGGRRQARRLAERLAGAPIGRVISSPIERAMETAAPLAARLGLEVEVREAFTELDFGAWTGRSFEALAREPEWRWFNEARSCTRAAGGELAVEVQARVVGELDRLRAGDPDGSIAVVTHGDVIRAALAWYAAIPIDLVLRVDVAHASVTALAVTGAGPRVLCVNHTDVLPGARGAG